MKTMITGFVLFILVATGLTQEKPVSWPVDSAEVVLPPIVITKTDSVFQAQNTNADLAQAVQKECKTTENNKEAK